MRYIQWLILLFLLCPKPLWAANDRLEEWSNFKNNIMSADGRIIDWQNEQRSHSEGQGFAMVLAVFMDDQASFELIFTWSQNNLGNNIRAWLWGESNGSWKIISTNNATDGDILHAWALLMAGEKWENASYTKEGKTILNELRNELIVNERIILPAREGFVTKHGFVTTNPSYYIFPALKDFERFDPEHALLWKKVYRNGLEIITQSTNTKTGLAPDWVQYDENYTLIPPEQDHLFGYDAIRIPLYLSMSKETQFLKPMASIIQNIAKTGYMADIYKLDGTPDSHHEALAGQYAVFARAASRLGMDSEAKALWDIAQKRQLTQQGNYYGTVLFLLSLLD